MTYKIIPPFGFRQIQFGLNRAALRKTLGEPQHSDEKSMLELEDIKIPSPAKDSYQDASLQLSFDDNLKLEYIEFSSHPLEKEKIDVEYEGLKILSILLWSW